MGVRLFMKRKLRRYGSTEYGIAGNQGNSFGLIYSCDNRFIEKDKSGIPYFTLETDRFYETASKMCSIKKDTKRLSGLTNELEL